jgi:hypothetical protein
MKSFNTKDSRGTNNFQGSPGTDVGDPGGGVGAGGVGATDCAELSACGSAEVRWVMPEAHGSQTRTRNS